jgi:hypothetical protein
MEHVTFNIETQDETKVDVDSQEMSNILNRNMADAWNAFRAERNRLLAASDWTVLGDSPTPTAIWKAYRQQLRDLPANTTDPFAPIWPTPPS